MRNAAILMLLATSCVVDDDLETATRESNLLCDPFCDPADPELQATLDGANRFAGSNFPDAVWRGQSCIDLEPGTECRVAYSTAASPCGPVTVGCTNFPIHGRNRVHCDWSMGGCDKTRGAAVEGDRLLHLRATATESIGHATRGAGGARPCALSRGRVRWHAIRDARERAPSGGSAPR